MICRKNGSLPQYANAIIHHIFAELFFTPYLCTSPKGHMFH